MLLILSSSLHRLVPSLTNKSSVNETGRATQKLEASLRNYFKVHSGPAIITATPQPMI